MMKRTLSVIAMITMMGSAGNVAADDSKLLQVLVARYKGLQSKVTALEAEVDASKTEMAVLTAALESKQDAMDCLYQVGTDLYVDGCNLHVQDGTGFSNLSSEPNGLGNLIVGYDEDKDYQVGLQQFSVEKTGSHNVIVGPYHTYTASNGIVTGITNSITGLGAAVIGGGSNVASGDGSAILGGNFNEASGLASSVGGGSKNVSDGNASSVSGGLTNTASGYASSVSGGTQNVSDGDAASVSGGLKNAASGSSSSVSGGVDNEANGGVSSVSGGVGNIADGDYEILP